MGTRTPHRAAGRERGIARTRCRSSARPRERKAAGDLWAESDYVFTKPLGGPLNPNTDYHDWKWLLEDAKVRDGRLHDARHPAATVLTLAEDTRFALVRGCPQHAFQVSVQGFT
jgi:hypothetical protein